ncbi:MAG: class I SAM-dependent methyltransferase, partial [Muribaculaceae bacterium]|nr:class I SAM-dependent methyltransferase [Muribaculaceae bacterium]
MDSSLIYKYFPDLTDNQRRQVEMMGELYAEWNARINVISRKDIDNLYANHVLHSLAIAKFLGPLVAGTRLLDIGTGGGFPGVPLAVYYPECQFHLIDRIGKKVKVAQEVST